MQWNDMTISCTKMLEAAVEVIQQIPIAVDTTLNLTGPIIDIQRLQSFENQKVTRGIKSNVVRLYSIENGTIF